ncbi:MAG TPA: tRNA pseudouridine(38-40) synthase TruA [Candidatus Baltobacteraceae bacterium]|nr:tRNA pseudouridine(38-40) synthase TruA [Candidatus Baltobacteraceae bacterium]
MGRLAGSGREAPGSEASTGGRLTTIRAVVEYDGSRFCGFQFQPAVRTVAGELERVFSRLLQHEVKITSAGRTDAGVHATGQVVSFKTEAAFPFERLTIAANTLLDADVAVRESAPAQENFSARFSALERTYIYAIYTARARSPLLSRQAYHVWQTLEAERMLAGVPYLIGEHDFRSFCGVLPESGPTIRTVKDLRIAQTGDVIRIEIRADGFLHRMVRTIVGTLVECGLKRRDPESIEAILEARDRSAAGLTAPPQGLYLAGVRYADGFDSFKEPPVTGAVAQSRVRYV